MATVIGVLEPVKTSFAHALHIEYRACNHHPTCTLGQVFTLGNVRVRVFVARSFPSLLTCFLPAT
jgi:hypothetical protein